MTGRYIPNDNDDNRKLELRFLSDETQRVGESEQHPRQTLTTTASGHIIALVCREPNAKERALHDALDVEHIE